MAGGMGARWCAGLLVLGGLSLQVTAAEAAETIEGRPAARGVFVAADVGAGWIQSGFRRTYTDLSLSGAAFDARAAVGARFGLFDVGGVAGGLVTSSFQDRLPGGAVDKRPERMQLVHAGGLVTWRLPVAVPLSIGGRLEAAYAWLPGTMSDVGPFPAEATIYTATAFGGLGALNVSYTPISGPHAALAAQIDLFGGALRSDVGNLRMYPVGAVASVGLRWH